MEILLRQPPLRRPRAVQARKPTEMANDLFRPLNAGEDSAARCPYHAVFIGVHPCPFAVKTL